MSVIGLRVGRYEIVELIGKGGFGIVYLARDVELGREVAIKFLRPEYLMRKQVVSRFLQEARACAKLSHAGIVTVFEAGEVENTGARFDGTAYIVMERLRGENLADRLEARGKLPPLTAIGIARQVAAALSVAHDAGIIHRDLKPDNVFIVKDAAVVGGERIKILDFGVAKLLDPDPEEDPNTHSQMMLGTPRYMSPEQARAAARVDHRTDIYALGCLLYELVCGKPPFAGDIGDVLVAHQSAPIIPPREIVTAIPAALDSLIVRMLAKDPDARPSSMRVVDAALDEVVGSLAPKKRAKTAPDDEKTTPHLPLSEEKTQPRKPLGPGTDEPTFRLKPSDTERDEPLLQDEDHTTKRVVEPAQPVSTETPVHMRATIIERPTATVRISPWWKYRYVIGVFAAVLSGVIVYLALRQPAARDERKAAPDAAIAIAPDAEVIAQPPDAASDDPDSIALACTTAQFDKQWKDLEDCGKRLAKHRKAEGKAFVDRAVAEAKSKLGLDTLEIALNKGDLKTASEALATIPETSVYRVPAQTAFDKGKGDALDRLVAELNVFAAARDCAKHADRLRSIESTHGKEIAEQARVVSRPCVRATGGPTTTLPTPLDACDKASVDEEERSGEAQLTASNFAAALASFEKVAKCRPAVARRAYLAACRSRAFPKAKRFFELAGSPENLVQLCLKEGFDPR